MNSESSSSLISNILVISLWILYVVAAWKVFSKAGKPGWGAIVPIYSWYLLLKIAGKPGWWLLLFFIPLVNIFIMFSTAIGLAKAFNRSSAFGIFFLGLFPPIGVLILGFGKSTYQGNIQTPSQQDMASQPPLINPVDQTTKV